MLLAIDPGLRACGAALFCPERGTLTWAGLIPSPCKSRDLALATVSMAKSILGQVPSGDVTRLCVEYPQQYRNAPAPRENTQALAGVAGAIGALYAAPPEYVRPYQWKGQVPKSVMGRRILSKLTPAERSQVPELPNSKRHNVVDAIGIGLHCLGRLKRGR